MRKKIYLGLFISLIASLCAKAGVIVNVFESGADLVFQTAGGNFDLSAADSVTGDSPLGAGLFNNTSANAGGAVGVTNAYNYFVFSGANEISSSATNWNISPSLIGADAVTVAGSFIGVDEGVDRVYGPQTFSISTSNTVSASTIVFNNTSLADHGLDLTSTITFTWGSGGAQDTLTFDVIPEPSSTAIAIGLGILPLMVWRLRARSQRSHRSKLQ